MAAPLLLLVGCYEPYVVDYEYSAVYTAYQYDLRSFVVGEDMTFDFGAVLGGVMENTADRIVRFEGTRLTTFEGTLTQLEAEQHRDRDAEDKQLQITALEMRLAALAARMAAPKKGDHPDQLNAEYAQIAEQLRQLKHSD